MKRILILLIPIILGNIFGYGIISFIAWDLTPFDLACVRIVLILDVGYIIYLLRKKG